MLRRLLPVLVLSALAVGCPRDVQKPEDPEGVPTCEQRSDCNDRSCGLLRACVHGLCESDASLVVPCLDAGP